MLWSTQGSHIEGRELKQDGAGFGSQSREARLHDVLGSIAGMQKVLVRCVATPASVAWVAPGWLRAPGMGFDDEAKIVRDGRGIGRIVGCWQGSVKRSVDTDRAQQGVLGIGGQTVSGEDTGRGDAVVDQPLPAWEGPRGRPKIDLTWQAARQRDHGRRHRGAPTAGGGWQESRGSEKIELGLGLSVSSHVTYPDA